jgi:hypothetical protein
VKIAEEIVPSINKGKIETISVDYITGEVDMHRFHISLYCVENLIYSDIDRVYVTEE